MTQEDQQQPVIKKPLRDDDPTPSVKRPLRDNDNEPPGRTVKKPIRDQLPEKKPPRDEPQSKLDSILSHLRGVQRQSVRQGIALCPGHADTNPSMSWTVKNGKFLFHCFAGCSQEQLQAKLAELGIPDFSVDEGVITRFEIRDPAGTLVAIHVRQDLPGGPKRMWWETPDGTRKLGTQLKKLPLYGVEHLANVPTDRAVILTEGERKRDVLATRGFVAVATVTGAATVPGYDSLRPLLGRPVYLWPDNDDAGWKHMQAIAERLRAMGDSA